MTKCTSVSDISSSERTHSWFSLHSLETLLGSLISESKMSNPLYSIYFAVNFVTFLSEQPTV